MLSNYCFFVEAARLKRNKVIQNYLANEIERQSRHEIPDVDDSLLFFNALVQLALKRCTAVDEHGHQGVEKGETKGGRDQTTELIKDHLG